MLILYRIRGKIVYLIFIAPYNKAWPVAGI